MNNQATVIYYTSNREDEAFEKKIGDRLLRTIGDMPLISVSQKPIKLGTNICVGERTRCDHNLYRQVWIGCRLATTPFVIMAESDCLYPQEYFRFIPPTVDKFYRYGQIWILYKKYDHYFRKSSSECAMIVGREFFINYIDRMLENRGFWKRREDSRKMRHLFREKDFELFGEEGDPVVNIKTGNSMRPYTTTLTNTSDIDSLPFWGSVNSLKKEFLT